MITGIQPSTINSIQTQPRFNKFPQDLPDMVIRTPEVCLICEHKVDACLGESQLEGYLKIAAAEEAEHKVPHQLVLITRDVLVIAQTVLEDRHFSSPSGLAHFRWLDVYRLVQTHHEQHPETMHHLEFLNCLRYLKLAFLNPTGSFNLLFSKVSAEQDEIQRQESAFGDAWKAIDGTVEYFQKLGYRVDYGSRKELYLFATDFSEISIADGLKHLHIRPIEGTDLPKSATFQPPCLKCTIKFYRPLADNCVKVLLDSTAVLKTFGLPLTAKVSATDINVWMPLSPILAAPELSNVLCVIVTEIYEKFVKCALPEITFVR